MSLTRVLALGRVAGGNHLTADCDEPEPTIMDLAGELQAMADRIKARGTPSYLKCGPGRFTGPPAPLVVKTPTVAEYRAALASHDWHFERSDDPSAYRAGRDSYEHILHLQSLLDPKRLLWAEYAPGASS